MFSVSENKVNHYFFIYFIQITYTKNIMAQNRAFKTNRLKYLSGLDVYDRNNGNKLSFISCCNWAAPPKLNLFFTTT